MRDSERPSLVALSKNFRGFLHSGDDELPLLLESTLG